MSAQLTSLADDVRHRGFAVWPDFATDDECRTVRTVADMLEGGEHAHCYPKSTRIWDLYQYDSIFVDVVANPGLAELLTDLLGADFLLSDFSLNVVGPAQPADDWHIDYPYNEMPRLVTGSLLGLQCVLALDRFDERNGATLLAPTTHHQPSVPSEPPTGPTVTFVAEPGTLLVMAAATWHRSGFNASERPRTAVLMSFVERWIRPLSEPLRPDQWADDPRLETMLGYRRPAETINGVPV